MLLSQIAQKTSKVRPPPDRLVQADLLFVARLELVVARPGTGLGAAGQLAVGARVARDEHVVAGNIVAVVDRVSQVAAVNTSGDYLKEKPLLS